MFSIPWVDPEGRLLDAALELARHGIPVFPCIPGGKNPLTPHGFKDATTNEATIRDWWERWPDANIAMPTGILADVVDIDTDKGGSLAALEALTGQLEPTYTVTTPHGGLHLHYTHREGITNAPGRLPKHIDSRGKGGYVLLPPSIVDGQRYTVTMDAPLRMMPDALYVVLTTPARENARTTTCGTHTPRLPSYWLNKYADKVILDGDTRNTTGFALACQLRDDRYAYDDARRVMRDYQERVKDFGPRNPPYTLDDADASLEQAYKGNAREPARTPELSQIGTILPKTYDGDALWDMDIPDVRWAIPDLIPEGLTILAGRPKAGKSYLALGLGLAVATGGRALGAIEVEQGRFLYLALEDNRGRLKERMRQLLHNRRPANGLPFEYALDWERLNEGGLERLEAFLDAHPDTRLVVIDTLAKVKPLARGSNAYNYQQDYHDVDGLTRLARERHVAILLIHHTRKTQGEYALDDVSGTSGITGAADAALVLRTRPGELAELHIQSRDVERSLIRLRREDDTSGWVIADDDVAEEFQLTGKQKAVAVALAGRGSMSPTDLWRSLGEVGSPSNAFYQLLKRMVRKGVVVHTYGEYALPSETAVSSVTESTTRQSEYNPSESDRLTGCTDSDGLTLRVLRFEEGDIDALADDEMEDILRGAEEARAQREREALAETWVEMEAVSW